MIAISHSILFLFSNPPVAFQITQNKNLSSPGGLHGPYDFQIASPPPPLPPFTYSAPGMLTSLQLLQSTL